MLFPTLATNEKIDFFFVDIFLENDEIFFLSGIPIFKWNTDVIQVLSNSQQGT